MPLMRNPFRSRPNDQVSDEHNRAGAERPESSLASSDSWNSRTKPLSVRTTSSGASDFKPTEYKLSEINDSGVYLPPSPTEKKAAFWPTRSATRGATSSRSSDVSNDIEPFSISRESFDCYRRSFDISARSPILSATPPRPRQSLDARQMRLPGAMTSAGATRDKRVLVPDQSSRRPTATPYQPKPVVLPDNHVNPPESPPDESEDALEQTSSSTIESTDAALMDPTTPAGTVADKFEDVGLGEPAAVGRAESPSFKKQQQHAKKPSIFSRFGGSSDSSTSKDEAKDGRPSSSGLGIGLGMFGRKRGASGQGAELGSMQQPVHGHAKKNSVSHTTAAAPDSKVDPGLT